MNSSSSANTNTITIVQICESNNYLSPFQKFVYELRAQEKKDNILNDYKFSLIIYKYLVKLSKKNLMFATKHIEEKGNHHRAKRLQLYSYL
jgi:hypothetical protein